MSKMTLNPDRAIVDNIKKFLKTNGGYCPCVEKNTDTLCPCKKFKEEQECCCGLYVKENENS